MGARITREEVLASLQASASTKAPGLDGLPYELWEALHISFEETPENKRAARGFDIITALTKSFHNIKDNGVGEGTNFTEGWMCPIYKKKEATEISNYRPVTLLNTDYKIFTKVLASRLAAVAHKLINKAQAEFVPNHSIADQVHLAKLMTAYSEATEENGMLICLD